MKSVGVKELKARLSEYIRLARAEETVLITDRNEVVAELRPARRQRRGGESPAEVLQALADAGDVTRPSLPKGTGPGRSGGSDCPRGPPGRAPRRDPRRGSTLLRPIGLYLDTSAVLPAVLETGTMPDVEEGIRAARLLITSRLSLVGSARALARLRL